MELVSTKFGFIGHSLGGLIIREGLKYLKNIRDRMVTFVSFNSPHLGCLSKRILVNTGKIFLFEIVFNKKLFRFLVPINACILFAFFNTRTKAFVPLGNQKILTSNESER